jgi:hypothetical protein
MMQFNINDRVRVKLTEYGKEVDRAEHARIFADRPWVAYRPHPEDAEGWSTWQLWYLMQTFGSSISFGRLPFETTIELGIDAP